MNRYEMLAALFEGCWQIIPERLEGLAALLYSTDALPKGEPIELFAVRVADERVIPYAAVEKGSANFGAVETGKEGVIAVVPIRGPIVPRENFVTRFFGLPTSEGIARAVSGAAANDQVAAILLDVDSPGGNAHGIPEASSRIYNARKAKPVYAVANHVAASAAYALASQAQRLFATPSSWVGSIGTIMQRLDVSKFDERLGFRVETIASSPMKAAMASEHVPLHDEAREALQQLVDDAHAQFVGAVARGRKTTATKVRSRFGSGEVFTAAEAQTRGMVDEVQPIEGAVAAIVRELRGNRGRARARARLSELITKHELTARPS